MCVIVPSVNFTMVSLKAVGSITFKCGFIDGNAFLISLSRLLTLCVVIFFLDKGRVAIPLSKLLVLVSILFLIVCGCLHVYEKLSLIVGTRSACFLLLLLVVVACSVVFLGGFGTGLLQFMEKTW